MRSLLACWRLLRAVAHVLAGWWIIRSTFARLTPQQQGARVQQWAGQMLAIMGIRLLVQGQPPEHGPLLLVSNHISWLDILTVHAARHVRFVAKSVIRGWPVLGALATGGGSLYIERERRRDALRVAHRMSQALAEGDLVAVFPEGTTSDGSGLLPFHGNLLQAAISAGAPIMPAALRFVDAASGQTSRAPRYIDDDNLIVSVWRVLTAPPLLAIVRFGEAQSSHGRDRRTWARSLHADVLALHAQACPEKKQRSEERC